MSADDIDIDAGITEAFMPSFMSSLPGAPVSTPPVDSLVQMAGGSPDVTGVKRGRGRPPKNGVSRVEPKPTTPGRGRGRPRKDGNVASPQAQGSTIQHQTRAPTAMPIHIPIPMSMPMTLVPGSGSTSVPVNAPIQDQAQKPIQYQIHAPMQLPVQAHNVNALAPTSASATAPVLATAPAPAPTPSQVPVEDKVIADFQALLLTIDFLQKKHTLPTFSSVRQGVEGITSGQFEMEHLIDVLSVCSQNFYIEWKHLSQEEGKPLQNSMCISFSHEAQVSNANSKSLSIGEKMQDYKKKIVEWAKLGKPRRFILPPEPALPRVGKTKAQTEFAVKLSVAAEESKNVR